MSITVNLRYKGKDGAAKKICRGDGQQWNC